MTIERIPLVFPFGGLTEDRAFDEQIPGTTREALNVRGVDPLTGRVRGAQRSGLARHVSAALGQGKVQDLQGLTYGQGLTDYSENSTPTLNWSRITPSETTGTSVATDVQGNVYVVDDAANIVKYNSEGELLLVQSISTSSGQAVVKRVLVGPTGSVFVATFGEAGQNGRLIRYDPVEVELDETVTKERLEIAYEVPILADVVDIAMRYGTLYALSSSGDRKAKLTAYGFLDSSEPVSVWDRAVPYPANKVVVDSSGSPICAFGPNENRAGATEGFSERSVSWVPNEIPNSSERIFHWIDAQSLRDTHSSFDEVQQWPERKNALQTAYWTDVFDATSRGLYSEFGAAGLSSGSQPPPEFLVNGFGDMPAVTFSGSQPANTTSAFGVALRTSTNADSVNRELPTQQLPNAGAIIPAYESASFFYACLLRISDTQTPQVFVSEVGEGAVFQIGFNMASYDNNASFADIGVDHRIWRSSGSLVIRYTNLRRSRNVDDTDPAATFYDGPGTMSCSYILDSNGLTDFAIQNSGTVLLTFSMPTPTPDKTLGGDNWLGTPGKIGEVRPQIRINGVTQAYDINYYDSDPTASTAGPSGPESETVIGWHSADQVYTHGELITVDEKVNLPVPPDAAGLPSTEHWDEYPTSGFSGELMEQIVWLADTVTDDDGLVPDVAGVTDYPDSANDEQVGRSGAIRRSELSSTYYNREAPYPHHTVDWMENTSVSGGQTFQHKCSSQPKYGPTSSVSVNSAMAGYETIRGFATEVEKVEGYLAHKYGVQHLLPNTVIADFQYRNVDKIVVTDSGTRLYDPGVGLQFTIHYTGGGDAYANGVIATVEDGYLVRLEKFKAATGGTPDLFGDEVTHSFKAYPSFGIIVPDDVKFHVVWESGWYDHPFAVVPPKTEGGGAALPVDPIAQNLYSPKPVVAKFKPSNGDLSAAFAGAGVGYGVTADSNNDIFCVGEPDAGGGGFEPYTIARKLISKSDGYSSETEDGAFIVVNLTGDNEGTDISDWTTGSVDTGLNQVYNQPQLATDTDDDFYWPVDGTATSRHLYRWNGRQLDASGAYSPIVQAKIGASGTDARFIYQLHSGNADQDGAGDAGYQAASQSAYSVAFDPVRPRYPDYGEGNPATLIGPESIYISTSLGSTGVRSLHKLTLIATQIVEGGSARKALMTAVNNGDIHVIDGSTKYTPEGGVQALDGASRHIQSETLFNKVYYTDGQNYRVYDPRGSELPNRLDIVKEWKAESGGEMPKRGKLLCGWRGRMVIAHLADDPQEWHMSKQGDPLDWDLYPPVMNVQQAVSGAVSKIGKVPDVVNCLIPYNDDLMIVGCDHTLWRFTGDPMFGGQLDLMSDITGISFGRPWCKDPEGIVYFFGSRGGVYAMAPAGAPQRITMKTIDRKLADIDLSVYRIELVWNTRDDGMHLFKIPYLGGGTVVSHFFWERKTGAWYEDKFGDTTCQPTAVAVLDGDGAADRALIIGGEDGIVRRWTETVNNDDGFPIDSRVLIGPVMKPETDFEFRIDQLEAVLASDQGGGNYEIIPTDDPGTVGNPYASGQLTAGRNPIIRSRARGAAIYIRLSNSSVGERWALEDIAVHGAGAGRRRLR